MRYTSSLLYYKTKRLFFVKKMKLQETCIAKKIFYKLLHRRFFYDNNLYLIVHKINHKTPHLYLDLE